MRLLFTFILLLASCDSDKFGDYINSSISIDNQKMIKYKINRAQYFTDLRGYCYVVFNIGSDAEAITSIPCTPNK